MTIVRPGIEVVQEIRNPTPNFVDPTLPALVMAPAYEVIDLYVDSALNSNAKYTDEDGNSYDNFKSLTFYQTEFPGGHVTESTGGLTNTKAGQVNVLEEEIRAFLNYGTVRELAEHDTSDNTRVLKGFLVSHNVANRPFVRGSVDLSAGGFALSGLFLSVAVDVVGGTYPHYLPNSSEGKDTVITFSTGSEVGGTLSPQDIVDQINAAVPNLAYLYTVGASQYLALVSPSYGANARVIVRDTGVASTLGFHTLGGGDVYALGAGFRARDDGDGDFESPYVELYTGLTRSNSASILVGALVAEPTTDLTDETNYDSGALPIANINFATGSFLQAGDEIIADGVSYGYMYAAQNTLLTLGTGPIAAATSEISKREVNLQTHGSAPWAPRYVYFMARNLSAIAPATSTQATLDSVNSASSVWNDPAPARVTSSGNPVFPLAFGAGLQFKYTAQVDGVPSSERTHIIAGTATLMSDLVDALNTGTSASGCTCSPPLSTYGEIYAIADGANIQFNTGPASGSDKTGRDQKLTIGNGSANSSLDPGAVNIVSNLTYQGLDHYSLDRAPGNGSTDARDRAIISGADTVGISVTGTKNFGIYAVKDNQTGVTYNLKATGDFSGGATPFATVELQALYNWSRALNGQSQSSVSGIIQIDDIDGDTALQDELLSTHSSLVMWEFQGPDKFVSISGTQTGTFAAGTAVSQATSGATGVIIATTGAGPTATLDIAVDEGSAAWDNTNTITDGSATLTGLTVEDRLALACSQDGSSNYVRIQEDGTDPLTDSIGFTDLQEVRGTGIRVGSQLLFHVDQNPVSLAVTVQGVPVQWNAAGIQTYVFLEDIVEDMNDVAKETIVELYDASGAGNSVIRFTSNKYGLPSEFKVNPQGEGSGNPGYVEVWIGDPTVFLAASLGLPYDEAAATLDQTSGAGAYVKGSGRPLPDFAVLSNNPAQIFIGSQALRDTVTGVPLSNALADMYLTYRGLREDITAARKDEGFSSLASILDVTELEEKYGPINEQNPFGLGLRLALANVTNVPVYGIGIGDVDADNPEGTLLAWEEALDYIESKRVYAIGPVTQDTRIHDLIAAHVAEMSQPTSRGERIMYCNSAIPTRAASTLVGSGLSAQNGPLTDTIQLDTSIVSALQATGVTNLATIPVAQDVYIELEGTNKRWNLQTVAAAGTGSLVTVRRSFGVTENTDLFFSTDAIPTGMVATDWAVYRRGAAITDKDDVASAIAAQGARFNTRRVRHLVAGSVVINLTGTEEEVSAAYLAPIYAAAASQQNPQQGFTNLPISGVVAVKGTNDTFSESQMDVIASGGNSIIVQPRTGGAIFSRHQLTTDVSSVETQEDSITRILDYSAYFLRDGLRGFIGTFNISPEFIDQLSTSIQGMLTKLEELGVIQSGTLDNLVVDESDPTQLLVQITLEVPYPANRIRLTLAI